MKLSDEDKEKLKKFTQDPDWYIMENIIKEYIKPFKNIESVDMSQNATSVKAEIRVRKEMVTKLTAYLNQVNAISYETNKDLNNGEWE